MDTNHSISIKPKDTESLQVVKEIKEHCLSKGTTFSYIVLKLLKQHHKEILDGKL